MQTSPPTRCRHCGKFDPTGEAIMRLTIDVGLTMADGRRTETVDFCRGVRVCREDAWRYCESFADGEVEEVLPPRGEGA